MRVKAHASMHPSFKIRVVISATYLIKSESSLTAIYRLTEISSKADLMYVSFFSSIRLSNVTRIYVAAIIQRKKLLAVIEVMLQRAEYLFCINTK